MKLVKSLVLWIVVLALAFSLCACSGNTDAPAKKQLVVGTSADYAPFEFHILDENKQDKIVGLDMSLAQKIADDMGAELVIKDMSFDFILEELQQGKIDLAIAALEEKGEGVAVYSDPYYMDYPSMIVIRKADKEKFTSAESFSGATVGVQSGSTKVALLGESFPGAQALQLTTVTDIINNVLYEKCDAALLDGSVALAYVAANDDLMVCDAVSLGATVPYVVIIQKDDPKGYLESVNKSVADAIEKGLVDQWAEEAEKLSADAIS